jgi:hypothetical protein
MLLSFAIILGLLCFIERTIAGSFTVQLKDGKKECTVLAGGRKKDDTPAILGAFSECNMGGKIIFPANQNVEIEWRGRWTV